MVIMMQRFTAKKKVNITHSNDIRRAGAPVDPPAIFCQM